MYFWGTSMACWNGVMSKRGGKWSLGGTHPRRRHNQIQIPAVPLGAALASVCSYGNESNNTLLRHKVSWGLNELSYAKCLMWCRGPINTWTYDYSCRRRHHHQALSASNPACSPLIPGLKHSFLSPTSLGSLSHTGRAPLFRLSWRL